MTPLYDYTSFEQICLVLVILFCSCALAEVLNYSKLCPSFSRTTHVYGYEVYNGPTTWKNTLSDSKGKLQSPINISSKQTVCIPSETLKPLQFSSDYYSLPQSMHACNYGRGVAVYGIWHNNAIPMLSGGPLSDRYVFDSVHFCWGPNDSEGSEHTIDNVRYAMEAHVLHIKEKGIYRDFADAAKNNALLCISYLYKVTPVDNLFIEPIISVLKNIKFPCTQTPTEPVPLSWLALPFTSQYYMYNGSLTFPPCTEGVNWLIQSEPLRISSKQVNKFRKLMSADGPLTSNTRPVQEVNSRSVYFYD